MQKIKDLLTDKLSGIMFGLLVIQPVLDVLSYFAGQYGLTAITTLLRFGLLGLVVLLGFLLTDKKRIYLILCSAIAAFWGAHMLNCFRIGYISPVQDTANLLRQLIFPLYALTFIIALNGRPHLRKVFYPGALIAFLEIILFTALPWLLGQRIYTYESLYLGVMGWFLIPNAQSSIIVLCAPMAIFGAYRTGKYPVYLLSILMPVALMFVTGTKLTFYSIFIICGAYIFLFALQLGKKSLSYVLPLLALLVLSTAFKGQSPMAVRDGMSAYSQNLYSSMIADSLSSTDTEQTAPNTVRNEEPQPTPVPQLEKVRRRVMPIYSDTGVYSFRTKDLNARFGVYNVMEVFDYSDSSAVLSNFRTLRLNYAELVWHEKDTLTHFLGLEYSDFLLEDTIYDLENDFPSIFYTMGYLGFALYLLFFALFFYHIFRAFTGSIQQAARIEMESAKGPRLFLWLRSFWRGLQQFMTIETGVVGICFLLAIAAAQISGYVMRRPNVAIYAAIAAACLYSITSSQPGPRLKKSLRPGLNSGGLHDDSNNIKH